MAEFFPLSRRTVLSALGGTPLAGIRSERVSQIEEPLFDVSFPSAVTLAPGEKASLKFSLTQVADDPAGDPVSGLRAFVGVRRCPDGPPNCQVSSWTEFEIVSHAEDAGDWTGESASSGSWVVTSPEDISSGETVSLSVTIRVGDDATPGDHEIAAVYQGFPTAPGLFPDISVDEAQAIPVTVEATDGNGGGTDESNGGPTPGFEYSPESPEPGEEVALDAGDSTVSGGEIASYEWDLDGDGEFEATGETVSHEFERGGEHEVTLRVTDSGGEQAATTETVPVEQFQVQLSLTADRGSILAGERFTLSLSVTNAGDELMESSVGFVDQGESYGNLPDPTADFTDDRFTIASREDGDAEGIELVSGGVFWKWEPLPADERREASVTVATPPDLSPGEYTFVVTRTGGATAPVPYATETITVEAGSPVELALEPDPSSIGPGESVTLTATLSNTSPDPLSNPALYFQSAASAETATADYFGDWFSVEAREDDGGDWNEEGWTWDALPADAGREPSVTLAAAEDLSPDEYTFLVGASLDGAGEPVTEATATVTVEAAESSGSVGVSVYQSSAQSIPNWTSADDADEIRTFDESDAQSLQGALHRLTFDGEVYDDRDSYDPDAGEFVAPVGGRYLVVLSVAVQHEGIVVAQVNVNGSPKAYDVGEADGGSAIQNESTPTATKVLDLDEGDAVVPYVAHAGDSRDGEDTIPGEEVTYLTIERLA